MVVVGLLRRRRLDALDASADDDVGELVVQRVERGVVGRVLQPEHETPVDEPLGVVVGVEAGDLVDGTLDVVGDQHQVEVVLADVPAR